MPQKWHAAIFGTIFPFGFLLLSYPSRCLKRWSFWASVAICLTVHLVGIWILFQYVFEKIQQFGWALWLPVAIVEALGLLVAVKNIEEKLTGKREIVELWGR